MFRSAVVCAAIAADGRGAMRRAGRECGSPEPDAGTNLWLAYALERLARQNEEHQADARRLHCQGQVPGPQGQRSDGTSSPIVSRTRCDHGRAPNLRSAAPACTAAFLGVLACLVPQAAVGQLQMQGQTLSLPPVRAPALPTISGAASDADADTSGAGGSVPRLRLSDCEVRRRTRRFAATRSLAAKDRTWRQRILALQPTLSAAKVKSLAASQNAWLRAREQCPAIGMTACSRRALRPAHAPDPGSARRNAEPTPQAAIRSAAPASRAAPVSNSR